MAKTSMSFGNTDGIYTSCSIGHTCFNTTVSFPINKDEIGWGGPAGELWILCRYKAQRIPTMCCNLLFQTESQNQHTFQQI